MKARVNTWWIVLAAICQGMLPVSANDDAVTTSRNVETIVYTTLRPPNWDVFLFDEGAASPRRLTDHPALDYNAVFSPDGEWVVFTSERTGNPELFALKLKTGDLYPLTQDKSMDDAAAFSPDGRSLAFVSTRNETADVYLVDFLPAEEHKDAVNLTNSIGNDLNPAFSPDGEKIAFSSDRDITGKSLSNAVGLFVMDVDGANPLRIKTGKTVDGSPTWSPDGKRLYFNSIGASFDPKPVRLYSISLDGSDLKELTDGDVYSFGATVLKDSTVAWTEAVDAAEGAQRSELFHQVGSSR